MRIGMGEMQTNFLNDRMDKYILMEIGKQTCWGKNLSSEKET